jgi:hypothetical protein
LEKEVFVSKLASAALLLRQARPKMTIKSSISSFSVPSALFSQMPHFRDILCNAHEKVLTAMAMPTIFPGSAVAPAAWRTPTAKATELVAVLPNTRNEMPKTQVARYLGSLRK